MTMMFRYCRMLPVAAMLVVLASGLPAAAADGESKQTDSPMAFSEYFMPRDDAPAASKLPSPEQDRNYIVGPGDVLDIMVWGKLQALYSVEVAWDGALAPVSDSRENVEEFFTFWPGTVAVNNKTLAQIQALMDESFSRYLKDNVRVSVMLSEPRSIRVRVMGQVTSPAEYTFEAGATLVEAIAAAGYTPTTSLRRIRVLRHGAAAAQGSKLAVDAAEHIDLYRYFVDFDMDANVLLRTGDVIQIPFVEMNATVSGGVNVPAMYEVLPGESLSDLVRFARGLHWSAETGHCVLQRRVSPGVVNSFEVNLEDKASGGHDLPLQNRDALMVLQSSDFQSMVKIVFDNMIGEKQDVASGLQELQKIVPLADGLTVIQLFARFRNRLVNADLANITLLRDGQKIRINYLEVLGNPSLDTALQNGDVIYVPKAVEYVYVLGEVNTPAMIKYGRDATILEYIAQAGGYKETAKLAIVTVLHTGQNGGSKELIDIKEWIKSGDKPAGGEILPGDIVIVPKDSSFKFRDYVDIVNSVIPTLSYLKIIND